MVPEDLIDAESFASLEDSGFVKWDGVVRECVRGAAAEAGAARSAPGLSFEQGQNIDTSDFRV